MLPVALYSADEPNYEHGGATGQEAVRKLRILEWIIVNLHPGIDVFLSKYIVMKLTANRSYRVGSKHVIDEWCGIVHAIDPRIHAHYSDSVKAYDQ